MSRKRGLWLWMTGVLLAGWIPAAAPAMPWDELFTFKRVEADPNSSYPVARENGPWMIMACTFSGERAEEQAHELVLELRNRYKLEAYTYNKRFDLGEVYGPGVNRYGERKRMQYQRGSEFEEVAVLVGDYPSVDDPQAQATLHKLKYYRPQCLEPNQSRPSYRTLAGWRFYTRFVSPEKEKLGPMAKAFISRNPVRPQEVPDRSGLDPLVLKANEGVDHSLLDCPGKYTVQVATFTGANVMRQDDIAAIRRGSKGMQSRLVEAAEKAHNLTQALRIKGYEAYEFHDRYASIVTVGSYDWVTRRLPNGQAQINPNIQAVIDRFGARKTNLGGQTGGWAQQTLVGIPFDLKPIAVHVPRRSISAQLSRDTRRMF
jgi:hypothetical protein